MLDYLGLNSEYIYIFVQLLTHSSPGTTLRKEEGQVTFEGGGVSGETSLTSISSPLPSLIHNQGL